MSDSNTHTSESKEEQKYEVDKYIYTPVHEQPWSFLIASIPKRLVGLISKMLGVKIAMFATATYIFVTQPETLPWYAWVVIYLITLFGWDALKYIDKLKK